VGVVAVFAKEPREEADRTPSNDGQIAKFFLRLFGLEVFAMSLVGSLLVASVLISSDAAGSPQA
jgi:hypothetical protein